MEYKNSKECQYFFPPLYYLFFILLFIFLFIAWNDTETLRSINSSGGKERVFHSHGFHQLFQSLVMQCFSSDLVFSLLEQRKIM